MKHFYYTTQILIFHNVYLQKSRGIVDQRFLCFFVKLNADDYYFIPPLLRKELDADGLAIFPRFLLGNGEGEQCLWIGDVAVEHGINRSISPLRMIGLSGNFAGWQIPNSLRNIHGKVQRPVEGVVIHNNHL